MMTDTESRLLRCVPSLGSVSGYLRDLEKIGVVTMKGQVVRSTCQTHLCLTHYRIGTVIHPEYAALQCVYCGVPGHTQDHLWPRGWSGATGRIYVPTVPACGQCNAFISDAFAPTVWERRDIAHQNIRRKYKKALRCAITETELEEFKGQLKLFVKGQILLKKHTLARLEWPLDPMYDIRAYQKGGLDIELMPRVA